ncbi:unnamed protein product, partial [Sphacelaria rigidula]
LLFIFFSSVVFLAWSKYGHTYRTAAVFLEKGFFYFDLLLCTLGVSRDGHARHTAGGVVESGFHLHSCFASQASRYGHVRRTAGCFAWGVVFILQSCRVVPCMRWSMDTPVALLKVLLGGGVFCGCVVFLACVGGMDIPTAEGFVEKLFLVLQSCCVLCTWLGMNTATALLEVLLRKFRHLGVLSCFLASVEVCTRPPRSWIILPGECLILQSSCILCICLAIDTPVGLLDPSVGGVFFPFCSPICCIYSGAWTRPSYCCCFGE